MNFLGRLHQCRTDKAESNKTWMTLENRYLQVKNLLTCLCARIASQILSMKNCKDDTSPIKTHSCLRVRNWKFLTKCCHYSIMWCWFWWQRKGAIHFGRLGGICWCHQPISQAPQHVASTPRKYRRHVRKTWIRFSHGHHGFSPTFWGWRSSNFPFFSSVLVRITMTFTISGWSQWGFTGNRWSAFGSLRFGEVCPMTFQGSVCF